MAASNLLQATLRRLTANRNAFFLTKVDLYDEYYIIALFSHLSHMHIMWHHMGSHGNGEDCDKTAQFTLCKQI